MFISNLHWGLVVRLLAVFFLCLSLQVIASQAGKQKVTVIASDVPLETVFKQIERQTGLRFTYAVDALDVSERVTISFKTKMLDEVLGELLGKKGIIWQYRGGTISLKMRGEMIKMVQIGSEPPITVTGRVVDAKGSPVLGATITVKGGKKGTMTNGQGIFKLDLDGVNFDAVLRISSVGYETKEIAISQDNCKDIIIQINSTNNMLDETVIIGYGKTTKRLNTGNVTTVKAEEIIKQPVDNPLYALQGRVPGLIVTPTTGLSGGPVNIEIRGRNTIRAAGTSGGGETSPLIVIDGLPVLNNVRGLGGDALGLTQFSTLSFLNPNDIESIEVLKDADATSIYGSRGANGVLLITTKRGQSNGSKISISTQTGWSTVPTRIKMLNLDQYINIRKQGYKNSGFDVSTLNKSRGNSDLTFFDQTRYTDWQDVLIGGTGKYTDLQGTLYGGGQYIHYTLGGTYHRQTTVFPGGKYDQRANIHFNMNSSSINKKLRSSITTNFLSNYTDYPGFDFTSIALTLAPNSPNMLTEDGKINWEPLPSGNSSWENPYTQLAKSYEAKVKNLLANAELAYEVIESLNIKAQFGYSLLSGSSFRKEILKAVSPPETINDPITSNFYNNEVTNFSFEPQANYITTIGRGRLEALIGGSIQNSRTSNQMIYASGYNNDALVRNLDAATTYRGNNSSSEYKYCAIFGRIHYNLLNKYILNINVRRDGSSRFGPGRQFGTFGSVGAAWVFSEETYIKDNLSGLSFGKIRASYGASGNDGIGDYGYLDKYTPIDVGEPYQGLRGYRTQGLFNEYYGWEITKKLELALETGFFKDKVVFSPVFYSNKSSNQLLSYIFPSMVGSGSPLYNLPASIKNYGFEATLQIENIKTKSLTWNTSINFSLNRNKLVSFPELEKSPYYGALEVGRPFTGEVKALKSAGVDPKTGQYQFYDINGNVTLNPEDPSRLDGGYFLRIMLGPKFYGGVSNSITYKGINLSLFVQFVKQTGYNPLSRFLMLPGTRTNLPAEYSSYWQSSDQNGAFQKPSVIVTTELRNSARRLSNSDFNFVDASFIRFKNVSLSYSVPTSILRNIKLTELKLFIHMQNLFTITNYKGYDPETQTLDRIPPLRTITAGINIVL
ncbi:SusC/RagA family TonB-linked outer membrane protein [Chitinophaga tropicalis]|uniref:SusC/RagA family TonB-linked outer membrane protein n=1 Tax=Chitinophaga tropicalis TaxID=2683588 RepID=A0A7K1U5L8_9BACT|nr:SusC/RagA family TonB-linked outer membrane protein [Chitinophaga tropicalis]MVT09661.1 SusC/RagA family TonB-linked outer membrane protein [Chitinophaga tropicalis]